MRIKTAGFNVEKSVIDDAISKGVEKELFTPEIISAAYARISRSPKTVDELRRDAKLNIPKARKSNESIVFDMGHASIAEHAVFNIDIEDISRLALEEFERHRIASYTEKSQRYVEVGKDYHIPAEWKNAGHAEKLTDFQQHCSELYFSLLEKGMDKEDARYYLPLSLTGQVGATINTRSIEHLILAASASPLAEMNELSEQLNSEISKIAPSLIRYVEPSKYHLREYSTGISPNEYLEETDLTGTLAELKGSPLGSVELINYPQNIDNLILAIRMVRKRGIPMSRAMSMISTLSEEMKKDQFREMFSDLSLHDSLPNDFEHINFTFEIILSAAAYAQLKRHRISDMSYSAYNPNLGFSHPPFEYDSLKPQIEDLIKKSHELFSLMAPHPSAQYALLSGHRRRIIWSANLRELHHFSRLREDEHAQWDIRVFAHTINKIIKSCAPLSTSLLCGKDSFEGSFSSLMEK